MAAGVVFTSSAKSSVINVFFPLVRVGNECTGCVKEG